MKKGDIIIPIQLKIDDFIFSKNFKAKIISIYNSQQISLEILSGRFKITTNKKEYNDQRVKGYITGRVKKKYFKKYLQNNYEIF